ncbi:hypothetical protein LQQ74_27410 (plasmid) [Escherichia coli]|nr:hypothetical protein LQQ74_27410 [Escherichia coli]
MSITPTAMQCLGWAMWAMARKDYPAAERYYQQTLRMDSGNTKRRARAGEYLPPAVARKTEAYIASLSASQRRSIDDIERSLQNDRLAQQAEALENQGKWAQASSLQRQRLALDPGSVWITSDFRRISGKPDNAARPIR